MTECQHQWESARESDEHGVEVTVLTCALCGHLWLPDFDSQPPTVPRLL